MRAGILAARAAEALSRSVAAADVLGKRFGVPEASDALKAAGHRDQAVSAMVQQEAVAALLEALVGATEPKVEEAPPPAEPEPEAKPHAARKGGRG